MASKFLGGGRLPVPVPTLGAELLTNGTFETGDPPSNWTAQNSATLSSVADPRTGSSGTKALAAARGTGQAAAQQSSITSAGNWYHVNGWMRKDTASSVSVALGGLAIGVSTATWTEIFGTQRSTSTNALVFNVNGSGGQAGRFDDFSVKPITLASMFSTRPYGTHVTVKAQATVTAGTRAGVVCNLDSASSPANFIIASHDGTTARLTKCVAGTYTELLAVTTTYAAGAYVEIRRILGTNDFELWYNNAQVSTAQTITDAGIISNVLAGMFNTYSGNTLAAFSCLPSTLPSYSWATAGDAPTPIAAYMPKGAASLAASYANLARTDGTYNAAPGTAPSFASATGWTFVAASSQYLTTGIIPASGWSMIVRYSGATGSGTVIVGSRVTGSETRFRFQWSDGTGVNYGSGGSVTVAPPLAAGVLGVAGQQGYRNGTADGGAISAWSGTGVAVYIGAQNLDGAAQLFASVSIQALAIYNTTLTASQILAVSNAMAAL